MTKESRRQTLSRPHILTRAVFILGALLTLSNLASIFDTWFHASSAPAPFTRQIPYPVSGTTLFGRQINATQCAYYSTKFARSNYTGLPDIDQLCGLVLPDKDAFDLSYSQGLQTLSNTSTTTRVAFTQDRHAIMVPVDWPQTSYIADTIGVQSSCER